MKLDTIKTEKKIMMPSIKCDHAFKSHSCNCILHMSEKINDRWIYEENNLKIYVKVQKDIY